MKGHTTQRHTDKGEKRIAVVLGGAGMLGQACCRALVGDGFTVIATYLDGTAPDIPGVGWQQMDMGTRSDIDRLIELIPEHGTVDAMVNTIANSLTYARFEELPFTKFEEDMAVNALNPAYLMQRMIPLFSEKASVVFVLTEMVADRPPIGFSSYVMSKYAALGLVRCMASELARKEIRVNSVSPGMMDTPFIHALPPMIRKLHLAKHHGRCTTPEEVAAAVLDLVRDHKANGENRVVA